MQQTAPQQQEPDSSPLHKRVDVPSAELDDFRILLHAVIAQIDDVLGNEANGTASACVPFSSTTNNPQLPPLFSTLFLPSTSDLLHVPTGSPIGLLPPLPTETLRFGPGPVVPFSPYHPEPITPTPDYPGISSLFRPLPSPAGYFNTSFISPTGFQRPNITALPTGGLNSTQYLNASSTYLLGSAAVFGTAISHVASQSITLTIPEISVDALSTASPIVATQLTTVIVLPLPSVPRPSIGAPSAPGTSTRTANAIIVTPFLASRTPLTHPTPAPAPIPVPLPVPAPASILQPPAQVHNNYTFDPTASTNVAVYYGQTPATAQLSLAQQCSDPNVDLAILAFVTEKQAIGSIFPAVDFGAACGGQTSLMEQVASGLLSCPELAGNITSCQKDFGKKVLLSIGGATGGVSFDSNEDAANFGNMLWSLFGDPLSTTLDPALRPFGSNVSVDGFDIDNENHLPAYYSSLASTLRTLTSTDSLSRKPYYLSSAPQCPFPDASNPLPLLLQCDFVWVQFYNNPPCELGSAGFGASLENWSRVLMLGENGVVDESGNMIYGQGPNGTVEGRGKGPMLFIGAPSFAQAGVGAAAAAGVGESQAAAAVGGVDGFRAVALGAKGMGLSNFGGVMFWDGPEGEENFGSGVAAVGGVNVIGATKEGLLGE